MRNHNIIFPSRENPCFLDEIGMGGDQGEGTWNMHSLPNTSLWTLFSLYKSSKGGALYRFYRHCYSYCTPPEWRSFLKSRHLNNLSLVRCRDLPDRFIATKAQKHQNTPKVFQWKSTFGVIWCFGVLVVKFAWIKTSRLLEVWASAWSIRAQY